MFFNKTFFLMIVILCLGCSIMCMDVDQQEITVLVVPSYKDRFYSSLEPFEIVQIIKEQELGSILRPDETEIVLIEEIKKTDPQKYEFLEVEVSQLNNQLINQRDAVHNVPKELFLLHEKILAEKKAEFARLTKEIEKYSQYCESNKKFSTDTKAVLAGMFIMLEMFTLIVTGMGAVSCWFS
jgi:hypothetical protein